MLFERSDFVVVTVGDKAYALGGCTVNQAGFGCTAVTDVMTVYDLKEDSWTELATAPRERYRYAAAAIGEKIYYVGGRDAVDNVIGEVDVYDIPTDTWSTLPDQNGNTLVSDSVAFVIGNVLYVVGGYDKIYNPLATTILLDSVASPNQTTVNEVSEKLVMAGDAGGVSVGGYGYVFGGFGALVGENVSFCDPLDYVERYDPSTNKWTMLSSLNHARGDMAFGSTDGYIFVMGGESVDDNCTNGVPTNEVEYYNIKDNTWSELSPIAIERFRFGGCYWNNMIYDFGGQGPETNGYYPVLDDVYSLDVSSITEEKSSAFQLFPSFILLVFVA